MQNSDYQIVSKKDSKELAKFLSKQGQLLLPMLDLIEPAAASASRLRPRSSGQGSVLSVTRTLLYNSDVGSHQFANSQAGCVVLCTVDAQSLTTAFRSMWPGHRSSCPGAVQRLLP